MDINIDKYTTTVIDNNDDVAEKTITLFKNVNKGWDGSSRNMTGKLLIKNVRNGYISYNFSDYTLGYQLSSTSYNVGLPSGMKIKTYKDNKIYKEETVLDVNDFNKIMGNAVIYSFGYDFVVDIEITFSFSYGLRTYRTGTTPSSCHCSCSKCSGGDPIYQTSSLYDYIDLKFTYNVSGDGSEEFYRFNADFDEFKESPGTYNFKREFELGNKNIRMVDIGINENKAIDLSFYDAEWDISKEEENKEDTIYKNGPCIRRRVIGTILKESVERIRDHSNGELPENPYTNTEVTEENIKQSDIFKRVGVTNTSNQIIELNTYNILNFSEKNKNGDIKLKTYLIVENNSKTKLVIEYIFNFPNITGKTNNRLRFKSKIDIGLNIKSK